VTERVPAYFGEGEEFMGMIKMRIDVMKKEEIKERNGIEM
jgi:hypothetical protein